MYNSTKIFRYIENLCLILTMNFRAVRRSENPGVPLFLLVIICPPPLVDIGLTDLPKSGGAMAFPAPPSG